MGIDRKDMREARKRMQLSLKAMSLKTESLSGKRVSEKLLWLLEESEANVTHPRIALRVAEAYGIDDAYSLMNPEWRGKEIPPEPEPSKDLLISIAGLGKEHKSSYTSCYAKPRSVCGGGSRKTYDGEDKELVDINGPAVAMLVLKSGKNSSDIDRDCDGKHSGWLRETLQGSERMRYGDIRILSVLLDVPKEVLLRDCPEEKLRKYLPDSYFEATPETRKRLASMSSASVREVDTARIRRRLEAMGKNDYKGMCELSLQAGLAKGHIYTFATKAKGSTLADAARIMEVLGLPPHKFFKREEDALVFTCASGALSAPTDRRRKIY